MSSLSVSGRLWTKSRLMTVAVGRLSLSDTSMHNMLKAFNCPARNFSAQGRLSSWGRYLKIQPQPQSRYRLIRCHV